MIELRSFILIIIILPIFGSNFYGQCILCESPKEVNTEPLYCGSQKALVDSMLFEAQFNQDALYEGIYYFCEVNLRQDIIRKVLSSELDYQGSVIFSCKIDEYGNSNSFKVRSQTTTTEEGIQFARIILDSLIFIHAHENNTPIGKLYSFKIDYDVINKSGILTDDFEYSKTDIITRKDSSQISLLLGASYRFEKELYTIRKIDDNIFSYFKNDPKRAAELFYKASGMKILPGWIRLLFASYLPPAAKARKIEEIQNQIGKEPQYEKILFYKELEIIYMLNEKNKGNNSFLCSMILV